MRKAFLGEFDMTINITMNNINGNHRKPLHAIDCFLIIIGIRYRGQKLASKSKSQYRLLNYDIGDPRIRKESLKFHVLISKKTQLVIFIVFIFFIWL